MYYVYVISSLKRKYIYVGLTNSINRRFKQHQQGKSRSTRAYCPFKLILKERYNSRIEARVREKYLKSGIGKDWIKGKLLII
jgi:putative endonuclease